MSEFKVGDRVRYVGSIEEYYRHIGVVIEVCRDLIRVKFEHDNTITSHYLNFIHVNLQEYKIGDRFLYDNEEVEIIGFYGSSCTDKFVYVREPVTFFIHHVRKDSLKQIPESLKEGQEVWIKGRYLEDCKDGDHRVQLKRWDGGVINACCNENIIYIKNKDGQIVPYRGE